MPIDPLKINEKCIENIEFTTTGTDIQVALGRTTFYAYLKVCLIFATLL